ncbi:MAG: MFS transporter, partial [Caldisericia bacterium]|nr:MFS transporter [Caldisericia bacterium]
SVYSFVFVGVAPIGSLYAGGLASKLGANMAFTISGIIGLIGTIIIGYIILNKTRKNHSRIN